MLTHSHVLPECAVVFVVLKLTHSLCSGLCCVKTHYVLPECVVVFVVLKLTHMCCLSVQWS